VLDHGPLHLSLWIPTYNRPDHLLFTLKTIIPQLSSNIGCTIIDNASDIPVETLLKRHFAPAELQHVKVFRNPLNIGGNANICRCFELCESAWVWILGDDDALVGDGIAAALAFIDAAGPECVFVGMDHQRQGVPLVCRNVNELARGAESLGALICLPMCLFRAERLRPYVCHAYQWLSTCAPQLVLVLQALHVAGGNAVLRRECLRVKEAVVPYRGSGAVIAWCIAALGHIPLACVDSPALRKLIPDMIRPLDLIYELRVGIRLGRFTPSHARRIFHSIAVMKYPFWRRPWETMRFYVFFTYDAMRSFRMDMLGDISAQKENRD
jgi:glycosyltransferase involved in cell wall biosynthesis